MLRATLKSLLARKLRLALSAVAIVLAVTFVSGALALDDTLGRSFDTAFASAYEDVRLQVAAEPPLGTLASNTSVPRPLDAATLGKVTAVPGVAGGTGEVRVPGARLIGKDGKVPATSGERYGQAWVDGRGGAKLRDGRAPQAPDEVVINAGLATKTGYAVGDRIGVLTLQPRRDFTVVGIAEYRGRPEFVAGEQTISFTEPAAQELMLGAPGAFNAINVQPAAGADIKQVQRDLKAALGNGYQVRTGEQVAKDTSGTSRGLLTTVTSLLLGFAAVAVLVGTFLIVNAFSVVVAQRTRELALLRAIGASRRQVRRSVLVEAGLVGFFSWLVGAALGIGLGRLVAGGLAGGDSGLAVSGFHLPVTALIVSFLVGVGVTTLAALIPAVRASRVRPIAAMREATVTDRPGHRQTAIGGLMIVVAGALLIVGLAGDALAALLGGVLLAFVGVALLIPAFTTPVVNGLARPFVRSTAGRLGWLNAVRHPRRTAMTAASLMIGVALVAGMTTVMASLQRSAAKTVQTRLNAELSINSGYVGSVPPTISPDALQRMRALPDVDGVAGYAFEPAKVNGADEYVLSWDDPAAAARIADLKFNAGSLSPDAVTLNESTAKRLHLKVGDKVTIQFSRGAAQSFEVGGVFADTQIADRVTVPWAAARSGFRTDQPNQAYVKLKPGVSPAAAKPAVAALVKDSPEVEVRTKDELIDQAASAVGDIITVIQLLLALAMVIAILGVVNILVLSVLERVREFGMLRAIGMRRGQVRRMVTLESMLISLFGALLGIVVGTGIGVAVVKGLASQGITNLALPWGLLIGYVVAALVIGVLAAFGPAARAAKLNVLEAIAYE